MNKNAQDHSKIIEKMAKIKHKILQVIKAKKNMTNLNIKLLSLYYSAMTQPE